MSQLLKPLIQGQSIYHIVATNRDRLFCSERHIYRLIEQQRLGIQAIDLPLKVRFRSRKQPKAHKVYTGCRIGRTYQDYQTYLAEQDCAVVQIDDDLCQRLGPADFFWLFPVILTDNGSEFSHPTAIEYAVDFYGYDPAKQTLNLSRSRTD